MKKQENWTPVAVYYQIFSILKVMVELENNGGNSTMFLSEAAGCGFNVSYCASYDGEHPAEHVVNQIDLGTEKAEKKITGLVDRWISKNEWKKTADQAFHQLTTDEKAELLEKWKGELDNAEIATSDCA